MNFWPWGKKNGIEETKSPVEAVRNMLGESKTGANALNTLKENGYDKNEHQSRFHRRFGDESKTRTLI